MSERRKRHLDAQTAIVQDKASGEDQPVDNLYDTDIYAWSQQQAAVLRDLASRPDLPNELDLQHVAEEIEDVGISELNAVRSFLRLCFVLCASDQGHFGR